MMCSCIQDDAVLRVLTTVGGCVVPVFSSHALESRISTHGLPRLYHCFKDESLNQALRDIASFCHRWTFPHRCHVLMDIMGRLGQDSLACQGGKLDLVAWPKRR